MDSQVNPELAYEEMKFKEVNDLSKAPQQDLSPRWSGSQVPALHHYAILLQPLCKALL